MDETLKWLLGNNRLQADFLRVKRRLIHAYGVLKKWSSNPPMRHFTLCDSFATTRPLSPWWAKGHSACLYGKWIIKDNFLYSVLLLRPIFPPSIICISFFSSLRRRNCKLVFALNNLSFDYHSLRLCYPLVFIAFFPNLFPAPLRSTSCVYHE